MEQSTLALLLIALFAIGIFLLLRDVVTWYFKLNTIAKNQERQNILLESILVQLSMKDFPDLNTTQNKVAIHNQLEEIITRKK